MSAMRVFVGIDLGSTTTKAILVERVGESWRQTQRAEAPTTVEEPFADVTIGVSNALTEIGELAGRRFIADDGVAGVTTNPAIFHKAIAGKRYYEEDLAALLYTSGTTGRSKALINLFNQSVRRANSAFLPLSMKCWISSKRMSSTLSSLQR